MIQLSAVDDQKGFFSLYRFMGDVLKINGTRRFFIDSDGFCFKINGEGFKKREFPLSKFVMQCEKIFLNLSNKI